MGSKYGRKGNKVWMLVRGVQTTTNVLRNVNIFKVSKLQTRIF